MLLLYWSLLPICDGPTCQKTIHLKGKQLAAARLAIEFILNPNPLYLLSLFNIFLMSVTIPSVFCLRKKQNTAVDPFPLMSEILYGNITFYCFSLQEKELRKSLGRVVKLVGL